MYNIEKASCIHTKHYFVNFYYLRLDSSHSKTCLNLTMKSLSTLPARIHLCSFFFHLLDRSVYIDRWDIDAVPCI